MDGHSALFRAGLRASDWFAGHANEKGLITPVASTLVALRRSASTGCRTDNLEPGQMLSGRQGESPGCLNQTPGAGSDRATDEDEYRTDSEQGSVRSLTPSEDE